MFTNKSKKTNIVSILTSPLVANLLVGELASLTREGVDLSAEEVGFQFEQKPAKTRKQGEGYSKLLRFLPLTLNF